MEKRKGLLILPAILPAKEKDADSSACGRSSSSFPREVQPTRFSIFSRAGQSLPSSPKKGRRPPLRCCLPVTLSAKSLSRERARFAPPPPPHWWLAWRSRSREIGRAHVCTPV